MSKYFLYSEVPKFRVKSKVRNQSFEKYLEHNTPRLFHGLAPNPAHNPTGYPVDYPFLPKYPRAPIHGL